MSSSVTIGIASETLNDWADEEAGLEAVQRVLDSLDDIHALQDLYVDDGVLHEMLTDPRLSALLQVKFINDHIFKKFWFANCNETVIPAMHLTQA